MDNKEAGHLETPTAEVYRRLENCGHCGQHTRERLQRYRVQRLTPLLQAITRHLSFSSNQPTVHCRKRCDH